MDEIEKINLEIAKMLEQLKEKRKEIVKAKLTEVQENGVSEKTKLTGEEYELLKDCIYKNDEYQTSALIQSEARQSQLAWEYGMGMDEVEEKCYLKIAEKIYNSFDNSIIDKERIHNEMEQDDAFSVSNLYGSKESLTTPLNIEKLFESKEKTITTIDIQELGKKIGMEAKEQKLPNGKVVNTLVWNQENLLKAVKEVAPLSEEGTPVRITGAAPAWLVSALTHAVHPCKVSVYMPQIGKDVDIPQLTHGEKNPEGEVDFKITEKDESVLVEYNMELPEGFTTYDENNVRKVVVPEVPQGKSVYISGRGPNYLTVAIAEAYAHTNSSVSLFQPGIGYTCSITHSRSKKLGDLTKDPLGKEKIKEQLSASKESVVRKDGIGR